MDARVWSAPSEVVHQVREYCAITEDQEVARKRDKPEEIVLKLHSPFVVETHQWSCLC